MEPLEKKRSAGLSIQAMRIWGMIFAAAGILGRGLLQNGLLQIHVLSGEELYHLLSQSGSAMILTTISLVLQAMETCAVPIFAFILLEGVKHTSSMKRYFLRVFALALVCELPYNLAICGSWLDLSSRNPVFGLVVSLVVLYFFKRYEEGSPIHYMIRFVVFLAGLLWLMLLSVEYGLPMLLLTLVLWLVRNQPRYRILVGALATVLCCFFSLFFMAAAMSFLILHFYEGEKGHGSRLGNYLVYPLLLLAVGLVTQFAL